MVGVFVRQLRSLVILEVLYYIATGHNNDNKPSKNNSPRMAREALRHLRAGRLLDLSLRPARLSVLRLTLLFSTGPAPSSCSSSHKKRPLSFSLSGGLTAIQADRLRPRGSTITHQLTRWQVTSKHTPANCVDRNQTLSGATDKRTGRSVCVCRRQFLADYLIFACAERVARSPKISVRDDPRPVGLRADSGDNATGC